MIKKKRVLENNGITGVIFGIVRVKYSIMGVLCYITCVIRSVVGVFYSIVGVICYN